MIECPWYDFAPATSKMCEASVCSWIVQPGNLSSCIAYFVVATLIFNRQKNRVLPWNLRFFAWNLFFISVSALMFYASRTFLFQAFDLAGMYFFAALVLISQFSIQRPLCFSARQQVIVYLILGFSSTVLFTAHPKHPSIITFLLLLAAGISSLVFSIFKNPGLERKNFSRAMGLLCLGGLFIAAEKTGFCDPGNHYFQWHSAWNFAAAFACYFLYLHFEGRFLSTKSVET
jgi:hypothetical protein